ncbi:FAD-binding oxidoreductase [Nitrogeniibacter aestuarii]|uniref:FAD-binding oxidoreductase n=1 Tax=Nitrogeniibacter aestuarii TaxID=2815343 RepID=UPI001E604976|nr:FAD-binding oxidoreductase [Nitrogeniibacter aestuarii]
MTELQTRLERCVGSDRVLDAEAARSRFGSNCAGYARRLLGAVRPSQTEQIADIVAIAREIGCSIYPISTGRNWGYGSSLPVSDDCLLIDLSDLNRILSFDADMGIVRVEPGVTQGQLARYLAENGAPYLVPVTGAGPNCSILANALERGYGVTPHADHFGALIALGAILPDGSRYSSPLMQASGEGVGPLFKTGIGPYLDGLFTQGNFGIVTDAHIALARKPESVKAILFSLKNEALLGEAVSRIRSILQTHAGVVGGINLMNQRRVLSMSVDYPEQVPGDESVLPADLVRRLGAEYQILPWTGFGTLYGSKRVVRATCRDIRSALRGVASRLLFVSSRDAERICTLTRFVPGRLGSKLAKTAQTLRTGLELVNGVPNETALPLAYWGRQHVKRTDEGQLNPAKDGCGLLWYAPLVPLKAEAVIRYQAFVTEVMTKWGFEPLITLTTVSDRVVDSTVPILFDRNDPSAQARAHECYWALQEQGRLQGFFPYRVGVDSMRWLEERIPESMQLIGKLKVAIDPEGTLAPGRYAPLTMETHKQ